MIWPGTRILVVDDEPVSRLITETVLTGQGFVVRSAESAEQAFAQLAEGFSPSLILLDVVMPGMSGTEAMQILHRDPSTAHIPVVALSANAIPSDIERVAAKARYQSARRKTSF